jgi:TetR/AcrR family transcriptional repressor of nem operon
MPEKAAKPMSGNQGSREKILLCARDLFYLVGYQTTSVDDILRESGVAKSNFYYHFRTKDELALAVLARNAAEFESTALSALTDREVDPPGRLERFCDALVRNQIDLHRLGGCPFGNFAAGLSIREDDERAQRFREALRDVFEQLHSALAACLREGVEHGSIRSDIPADQLAAIALAAVEGFMLMTKTQRSAAPLHQGLPVLRLLFRVG